jgi:uncharacterized protein YbjT (DUF2867 family)
LHQPASELLDATFCRFQTVYVVDVAAAIVNSLKDDGTSMGKTYELGGPDVYTVRDLVITIHNCYAIITMLNLV